MARTSETTVQNESTVGASTILPGVPLPMWALPTEPVLPEPPAAPLVAESPAPWDAPLAVPEPAVHAEALMPVAVPAAMAATAVATVDLATLPAPDQTPVGLEAPVALEAAPAPDTAPLPEALVAAAVVGGDVLPAPERIPHRHGRGPDEPQEPRRRLFGRSRRPEPEAAALASAAALADPATEPVVTLAPEAAAPVEAPLAAPAPALAPPSPAAGPGMPDEGSPAPRSRRPMVLLLLLGVVAALAAIAAFVWPGLLLPAAEDEAAPRTTKPVASAPSAVTLQTPATVAGLTALTTPEATAFSTAASATTLTGYTAPVSAVYGTGGVAQATVIAWTATATPKSSPVSAAFGGFLNAGGVAVTAIAPVSTGTLGGEMTCGVSTVGGVPATVCFWVDDTTFGTVKVLRPTTPEQGATTAVQIRQAVETRG